ncbi:RhoGAP-domain-containing protein [Pilatotrama ljubarskyi]|nr:RhoGAP-domain-containing protein [Pilatotrama ljubarskyi]
MEDEDSAYDSGANGASSGSVQVTSFDDNSVAHGSDGSDTRRRDAAAARKPPAVEDFPLPPSTTAVAAQYAAQAAGTPPRSGNSTETRDSRPSLSTSDSHGHQAPSLASSQSLVSEQQPPPSPFPLPLPQGPPRMGFRALPLLAEDLPYTEVVVSNSTIRPNDRGKEVLSFIITVDPGRGKESWKIEKLYSDVLGLDTRVRATVGRSAAKKLATLPEGRLWRDHAPAKVDQRKAALEQYLRSLIALPVKNKDEVVAFFTSDIVRDTAKPVSQAGYKEGYLTKRGKNFGGWKTRYFVLQGPSLEYYESRGGTHLGSITITGAQIGRQQRTPEKREGDEDNEYRHAFLIIEPKRGPNGATARHVLCAESDEERDSWVEELVRYVTGTYNDEQVPVSNIGGPSPVALSSVAQQAAQPRSSTSSNPPTDLQTTPVRRSTKEIVIAKGPAMPISQLAPDSSNAKLFNATAYPEMPSNSPAKSIAPSVAERLEADVPLSSSLPVTSPLVEEPETTLALGQRANSELGHYPDLVDQRATATRSPEQIKRNKMKRMSMKPPSIPERSSSPEKDAGPNTPRVDAHGKVKISGPMNGTPIPAGYKFGGKDAPPQEQPPPLPTANDRREKTKSRTFKTWGFGRTHDKAAVAVPTYVPRAVFGVSLEESLDVAQIASLPAIVFRCIQYLEAKKAEQEEGIYRLSGSSAVIKALKDRFNAEGDVDLLASDEYWDPHAIAGLLKTFLRELPASILTRDLHLRFLSVIDFVDPQERIRELSHLISSLPLANYSLLRALTAHLILIVQNSGVNKMTMRNVGIVFSPTLGIPAGVFSLMLGEFKRVFNVDGTLEEAAANGDGEEAQSSSARRNSQHYSEAAADQMLGLAGRTLPVQQEEAQSDDGDDIVEESGTEATTENDSESVVESSAASSSAHANVYVELTQPPVEYTQDGQYAAAQSSRASKLAASRGLSVTTDKASRRHSRMIGLPHSPRPPPQGPPPPHVQVPSPVQGPPSSPRPTESLAAMPTSPAAPVSPQRPT